MRLHVTYANVTATLALVLALGGASYAAFKLPPNSVGRAELKPRAVDARALAVPIAAAAKVDESSRTLTGNPTPHCPPQPEGTPPCAITPAPPVETTLETVRLRTEEPGLLLVSAVAGAAVSERDTNGGIQLSADLDKARLPGTAFADVPANQIGQITYSSSSPLPAGKHVLKLKAAVTSFDTRLYVTPVSLHATVLPRAALPSRD